MRRRRLGKELRRRRIDAEISPEQAAEVLDCSVSRIGHIETGRNALRKPDLTVLLDLYGASRAERDVLEDLRKESARRGWWATYRLPSWLQTWVGMEAEATRIRVFELELITGLLQTKRYAQLVHQIGEDYVPTGSLDRLVDARLRRQEILDDPAAPEFDVILSESAIARTAALGEVGTEQLRRLVKVADKPNVSVRILPHSVGLHASMSGSFHLMDFDPEASVPVAFQEYAVGGHLIDDGEVVATLGAVFERLSASALDQRDSIAFIEGMRT